ncbi:MAG: DUF962 domain-containing protein [Crocinitomicaceae bacterium]|nr:DUF962 domain-containing protein [Crocinitomicaceae bacterium]
MIRTIPTPALFQEISPYFNWGTIILVLVLVYYLLLSIPLFLGFIVWALIVAAGNELFYQKFGSNGLLPFSFMIFALAWVGQFIGHGIEGKKPSFFKDLQFLLIGPAWLMNFVLKVVKY